MELALDAVTSGYGGIPIVREVSLEVGAGEIVAISGRNGVGK
jgi:branched-chain amino acid transport system ATP-binding protein